MEKTLARMHSFVVEPMQYKHIFLAGDAAHIVPPTGAKGLNLAVGDVWFLYEGLDEWFSQGRGKLLKRYSTRCLKRVWRAQEFTTGMTTLLHKSPGDDDFEQRLRLARLDYVCDSPSAMRSLAENCVGLPYR